MSLTTLEKIMYSTVRFTAFKEKLGKTETGTAFMLSFPNKEPLLVTSRHALKDCNHAKFSFTGTNAEGCPLPQTTISCDLRFPSCLFHPNEAVDLAALPMGKYIRDIEKQRGITPFFKSLDSTMIPSKQQWEQLDAIEEIVMVGYPYTVRDDYNNLPIFRRGITASHPSYNYMGKPTFLMDMSCFPGSSGSPIFIIDSGAIRQDRQSGNYSVKFRKYLLGIQFETKTFQAENPIKSTDENIHTENMKAGTTYYLNLGVAVKSTELLAFETMF